MHLPSWLQSKWSDASCLIPCILLSCLQLLGQQQPLLLLPYHRCRSGRRYLGWWYLMLGFASSPWDKGSSIGSITVCPLPSQPAPSLLDIAPSYCGRGVFDAAHCSCMADHVGPWRQPSSQIGRCEAGRLPLPAQSDAHCYSNGFVRLA